MSTVTSVPFSKLVASDDVNARAATKDGLDELAASIAAKGLIQPLAVRPAADSDKFEVIDGRRRFLALQRLVKAKTLPKGYEVPVLVRNEDNAEALETSLMANTVRLPMHPVDQHEVFARLAEQGRSESEIASRFGLAERTVRQHLALGRLAPVIREAWRKGKIEADVAKAFTLHPNHEVQAAAFEKLKKETRGNFTDWSVRQELSGERVPINDERVKLVGLDAYRAAGGKMMESLFDEESYLEDGPLLDTLVAERVKAEVAKYVADGWAWAELNDNLPHGVWQWPRIDEERDREDDPTKFTAEEKATSGVVFNISWDGKFEIYECGVIRPDGESAATADSDDDEADDLPGVRAMLDAEDDAGDEAASEDDEPTEPDGPTISRALLETITTAQTQAVATVVKEDFELSLRIAVAGLLSNDWSSPAKLALTSQAPGKGDGGRIMRSDFAKAWPSVKQMTYGEVMQEFARLVSGSLNLAEVLHQSSCREGSVALVAALPEAKYTLWMREAFLADDFFKRATKDVALAALDEMREAGHGPLPPDDVLAGAKKPDLAAIAATAAKACGWLPAELRHPAYTLDLTDKKEAAE